VAGLQSSWEVVDATEADAMALRGDISSRSPAFLAVSLEVGTIFRTGRVDIAKVVCMASKTVPALPLP
jgi:hypothetical protein